MSGDAGSELKEKAQLVQPPFSGMTRWHQPNASGGS